MGPSACTRWGLFFLKPLLCIATLPREGLACASFTSLNESAGHLMRCIDAYIVTVRTA